MAETTLHFSIWMIPQLLLTMVMIQNIYDSALYYANTERHMKYPNKTTTSIQQVVEQPEIYMVGQCIDALTISYTNKTIKTCCDHRLTLVKVLLQLDNRLPYQCYIILYTLAEIQHIV